MSDRINLLERVGNLDISPQFEGYTRVVVWLDSQDDEGNDLFYAAGSETGRTLELTCPWGTQAMANAILQRINVGKLTGRAFQYQPYTADLAILDPAAELGDGVGVKDIYSGIYSQVERFGRRHLSDIEAPTEEEIDHEYPFESSTNRKTERRFSQERAERKAELRVTNAELDARVSKEYDSQTEAFGWRLVENLFAVYDGTPDNYVLRVDPNGLTVKGSGEFTGTVTANAGKIGSFTIEDGVLRYGKTSLTDANTGVFISSSGIALGKSSAFKVDSNGNLTIGNGAFTVDSAGNVKITKGSINIGSGKFVVDSNGNLTAESGTFKGNIYAKNIQYGNTAGTFNGAGITKNSISGGGSSGSGQIAGGTIKGWNIGSSTVDNDNLTKSLRNAIAEIESSAEYLSGEKKIPKLVVGTLKMGDNTVVNHYRADDGYYYLAYKA